MLSKIVLRKVAIQCKSPNVQRGKVLWRKSAHVSENLKTRLYHTEQETVEIAGEEAQVEIGGGGETIEQRRDGVQDEHRYGVAESLH